MGIFVGKHTRALCQGITGKQASIHTKAALAYGTQIVGGISPSKPEGHHLSVPLFPSVAAAAQATGATASILYVPPAQCKSAIQEAIEANIKLLICITEGIPVHDMIEIKAQLKRHEVRMIGPNSPGIITPGSCKLGIMPAHIHQPGSIGIISRSGTLTYEAVQQTSALGLGQSTCIGIGGDPIIGMDFSEVLIEFERDPQTEAIILIGEIGGTLENDAIEVIRHHITKPIISYIAGWSAPKRRRMGHAGAIITEAQESAEIKNALLQRAGVNVVTTPMEIGSALKNALC